MDSDFSNLVYKYKSVKNFDFSAATKPKKHSTKTKSS